MQEAQRLTGQLSNASNSGEDRPHNGDQSRHTQPGPTLMEKAGRLMLELAGFYLLLAALNALWQLATR